MIIDLLEEMQKLKDSLTRIDQERGLIYSRLGEIGRKIDKATETGSVEQVKISDLKSSIKELHTEIKNNKRKLKNNTGFMTFGEWCQKNNYQKPKFDPGKNSKYVKLYYMFDKERKNVRH